MWEEASCSMLQSLHCVLYLVINTYNSAPRSLGLQEFVYSNCSMVFHIICLKKVYFFQQFCSIITNCHSYEYSTEEEECILHAVGPIQCRQYIGPRTPFLSNCQQSSTSEWTSTSSQTTTTTQTTISTTHSSTTYINTSSSLSTYPSTSPDPTETTYSDPSTYPTPTTYPPLSST